MITMEELLASQSQKLTTLYRGQEVEGEIVAISDKEITLDLGTKSEGIIPTRDINKDQLGGLKVKDRLSAFVYMPESESGQVILTLEKKTAHLEGDRTRFRGGSFRSGRGRGGRSTDWSKFIQAQNQKSKLQGKVLEVNKGGLIVEVSGARGFLPNSQVGFELLSKAGAGLEDLIGQDLTVTVVEIDSENNKLIFSQRGQISEDTLKKLESFKNNQKVKGKIVAVLPFGLVVDINKVEGLVFIADVSWEKVDDLSKIFSQGQELEVLVTGPDIELGRLNLSIKKLTEDPFAELAQKYPADEVVKGEVIGISESGAFVKLNDGLEGFLPVSKMGSETFEIGKQITLLVDNVDVKKRRINLAPMITSTAGLIYK